MNLHINGEPKDFPSSSPAQFTLTALIESLGIKSDRVAVELNREIAPRNLWPQTVLKDGDRLEIVHFVGGGAPVILSKHSLGSEDLGELRVASHTLRCNDRAFSSLPHWVLATTPSAFGS
ncbi:MAG: sulfur carrier protein ThiS [Candidatus Sulfotelmatobacter sp.]